MQISGSGTSGNLVLGNKIGTDKSGSINLGNVGDGVSLLGGASNNTIGGTASGTGNFIAFNAEGVVLNGVTTVGNSILGNSIFSNKGAGIDLGSPAGNHGQKAPASATVTGASYSATLTSAANGTYRVEVFASPSSGPALQGVRRSWAAANDRPHHRAARQFHDQRPGDPRRFDGDGDGDQPEHPRHVGLLHGDRDARDEDRRHQQSNDNAEQQGADDPVDGGTW